MELGQYIEKLKQKQKGFTLVELIVVIAIIGILAGVMLPKYFGFSEEAREKAVISEAKSIRAIAETYYTNHGDWPTITITSGQVQLQDNDTVFKGTISSYSATEAGTAVAANTKISSDGSFNYVKTGNDQYRACCDPSGSITVKKID